MPLITPLALLGLLFVPAVIAMYLLRLRRQETPVPSTLLWHRLVADVEANAPWQRLRRSLLFLLQLLLVIILVLLAARPFLERPAGLARDIVLVVDTSASMASTDLQPNRLAAAKQAAIDALRELPTGGKVSVVEAGRTARIVAAGSTDLGRIRLAIESIQPTSAPGDLGDALALASELAAQSGDAEILVATDAALATVPQVSVDAPVRVLRVGTDEGGSRNQALVALAVRTAPSGVTRSVFVSIANLDVANAQRRLELWGDGLLLESRDVDIDAQQRADVIIDDVDGDVEVVEVRLVARDPADTAPPDLLAADDRAWAIVPPDRDREILLVGDGDPFLETALSYLPNTALFGVKPDRYPQDARRTDGTEWDLIIFEDFVPAELPAAPTLLVAPTRTSPLGTVTGSLEDPGIGSLSSDEPILRYVDLTTTHISEAVELELPDWARSVIPGPKGAPLLYAGVRAERPERRPRLRAAEQRSAAPGGVPDPDREPDRRADGRQRRPDRYRRARRPGLAAARGRGDRPACPAAGRVRRRAGPWHDRRGGRHVHPDRPARRVHRDSGLPGGGDSVRRCLLPDADASPDRRSIRRRGRRTCGGP